MTDDDPQDAGCQLCGRAPEGTDDAYVDGAPDTPRRTYVTMTKNVVQYDADGIVASDRTELFLLCGNCWDARLKPALAALGATVLDAGDAA